MLMNIFELCTAGIPGIDVSKWLHKSRSRAPLKTLSSTYLLARKSVAHVAPLRTLSQFSIYPLVWGKCPDSLQLEAAN